MDFRKEFIFAFIFLFTLWISPKFELVIAQSPTSVAKFQTNGIIDEVVDSILDWLLGTNRGGSSGGSGVTPTPASGAPINLPTIDPQVPTPVVQIPAGQCNIRSEYPNNAIVANHDGICKYCAGSVNSNNYTCIDKLTRASEIAPKLSPEAIFNLKAVSLMYDNGNKSGLKYLQCKVYAVAIVKSLYGKSLPSGGGIGAKSLKNLKGEGGFTFYSFYDAQGNRNLSVAGRNGDLVVYDSTTSQFGHVGVIVKVNGVTGFEVAQANARLLGDVSIKSTPIASRIINQAKLHPIGIVRVN